MQSQDKYLMTMSSLDCKLYVEKRDRDLNNTYRNRKDFSNKIVVRSELDSFFFPAFSIHCQEHELLKSQHNSEYPFFQRNSTIRFSHIRTT